MKHLCHNDLHFKYWGVIRCYRSAIIKLKHRLTFGLWAEFGSADSRRPCLAFWFMSGCWTVAGCLRPGRVWRCVHVTGKGLSPLVCVSFVKVCVWVGVGSRGDNKFWLLSGMFNINALGKPCSIVANMLGLAWDQLTAPMLQPWILPVYIYLQLWLISKDR